MAKKEPPFTLEQTWKNQLALSGWVAEQIKKKSALTVRKLKRKWLQQNNFSLRLKNGCFFCDYGKRVNHKDICKNCPAVLVSKRFWCMNFSYHFVLKSVKFYAKLVELNKKRLAAKRKKTKNLVLKLISPPPIEKVKALRFVIKVQGF